MCMYMRIIRVPKIWFCSFHKPQIFNTNFQWFSIIHKFSLRLHVISHINTVIELMHTIFNRSTFCFIFVTFGRSSPFSYFHFHVFSLIYVLSPLHAYVNIPIIWLLYTLFVYPQLVGLLTHVCCRQLTFGFIHYVPSCLLHTFLRHIHTLCVFTSHLSTTCFFAFAQSWKCRCAQIGNIPRI